MKTSIEFINHASVIINGNDISILTDPWYKDNVFHKGWNLLHETSDNEVYEILEKVSHIWLSHEHPDHFSIKFFKTFKNQILKNSIKILFQKTNDKRVIKFLTTLGFDCRELNFNEKVSLSSDFYVTCIKDGFYDSGLLIENLGEKILNLNDCEITSRKRAKEVLSITGEVDMLLTQFSFAAWKGGKQNRKWRKESALEKLKTIELQINVFKPKFVIPFASFIYFSNTENFYLNDAINRPSHVIKYFSKFNFKIIFMKPKDILGGKLENNDNNLAIKFWEQKYDLINSDLLHNYNSISIDEIRISFKKYCERIAKNNSKWLIKVLKILSPISVFKPVVIKLTDLNCTLKFDYISNYIEQTNDLPMLSMKSESLYFLFNNSFGFDTLTVNGCFEEEQRGGFIQATKTLAIENMNNLGINLEFKTLFNFYVIKLFLNRLYRVSRKLDL